MIESQAATLTLGWREWVALPELGLKRIKAKVDTGARTSALHAFQVDEFSKDDQSWVRFKIHPKQRRNDIETICEAVIKDRRIVRDSGGHEELRLVIETMLEIGKDRWPIEVTLTSRDDMRFRMLLGRTAVRNRAVVDPSRSYVVSRRPRVAR
jgi:hypothetical protein